MKLYALPSCDADPRRKAGAGAHTFGTASDPQRLPRAKTESAPILEAAPWESRAIHGMWIATPDTVVGRKKDMVNS